MSASRPVPLKRQLVVRLLAFQISILLVFSAAFVAYLIRADDGGALIDSNFAEVAVRAIRRDADGQLRLVKTRDLEALRASTPDMWFVARSDRGELIAFGKMPALYRPIAHNLDRITFADIRDTSPPFRDIAVVRRASGPAGAFTVLGKGGLFSMTFVVLFLSNLMMIPVLSLLAVITIVVTPLIIRRAFRRLSIAARQAGRIDIDRRGTRLSPEGLPAEVVPLIESMNGALCRLDEGYDRQQRFIVDAAHELRTPIAILQAKIEASADVPLVSRLQRDVARLATLAEQLLDLQRLERFAPLREGVDLGQIARGVAADIAPLVITGGGDLEVADLGGRPVRGDPAAIERMLANLIQNAVDHGGRNVILRVQGEAIEVEDDGPGIPVEERDRVFDPFHRLRARETGSGLGLNLIRQVMTLHGGTAHALEAPAGGTIMRLEFVESTQG
ncbi:MULTISPECIES: HAMP domain-containing sensor histidine kinase [Sphingomonas]|uniref:histidine kinase n=1 Tax=Sphingomonas leidyi TaxID=68569 RepID=A0A7X5ZX19_9SPHN|nr:MULTISPECIES: HAMP domain-containing sensor histidine kinase [Sphingomonas]MBN8812521.1 HAMP domain-containing histidine kinase [Sphingomonas sp.]NIJ66795.1 signal transduction histidine kinase [Sphingomonas leidyi]OJY52156.1 MAG: two-component sensor histidine kinase [Sphingomonas sp. 67-41]